MSERRTKKYNLQIPGVKEVNEIIKVCQKNAKKTAKGKTRSVTGSRRTSAVQNTAVCPRRPSARTVSHRKSDLRESLTRDMDRAIRSTYYREGGFRFFASNFALYVKVNLSQESDLDFMWAAGYNTNLAPMVRLQQKLEKDLEALQADSDVEPLELKNQELRELMAEFINRIHEDRLDSKENWEAEDYLQALQSYCEDLNLRLLDKYYPSEGGNL